MRVLTVVYVEEMASNNVTTCCFKMFWFWLKCDFQHTVTHFFLVNCRSTTHTWITLEIMGNMRSNTYTHQHPCILDKYKVPYVACEYVCMRVCVFMSHIFCEMWEICTHHHPLSYCVHKHDLLTIRKRWVNWNVAVVSIQDCKHWCFSSDFALALISLINLGRQFVRVSGT